MRDITSQVVLSFVLLLDLSLGCSTSSHRPEAGPGGPLAVLAAQETAWNRGDIPAFMDGYWRSEETSFSSDQGTIHGWTTVMTRYEKRYPSAAAMGKVHFDQLETIPLGEDGIVVKGRWKLDRDGGGLEGIFTLVFRRFGDGWKIVHDHTSSFSR